MNYRLLAAAFLCAATPVSAQDIMSEKQMCDRMTSRSDSGVTNYDDCACMYKSADRVLDDDIMALLTVSWADGVNNMDALGTLPNRERIEPQLTKLKERIDKRCFKS